MKNKKTVKKENTLKFVINTHLSQNFCSTNFFSFVNQLFSRAKQSSFNFKLI